MFRRPEYYVLYQTLDQSLCSSFCGVILTHVQLMTAGLFYWGEPERAPQYRCKRWNFCLFVYIYCGQLSVYLVILITPTGCDKLNCIRSHSFTCIIRSCSVLLCEFRQRLNVLIHAVQKYGYCWTEKDKTSSATKTTRTQLSEKTPPV